jgi:hypothetical protein
MTRAHCSHFAILALRELDDFDDLVERSRAKQTKRLNLLIADAVAPFLMRAVAHRLHLVL